MKNKTAIAVVILVLSLPVMNAQVTIGSQDPPHSSAVLELKTSDKGFLGPQVNLTDIWDKATVPNYTDGLLVLNRHNSEQNIPFSEKVKAGKYYYWSVDRWVELVVTKSMTENIEQTLSLKGIPRPAIFTLNGEQRIFSESPVGDRTYDDMMGVINPLKGVMENNTAFLPFKEQVNYTSGTVVLDSEHIGSGKKYRIIFQPGIYSVVFTYEFVPADTAEGNPTPGRDRCFSAVYFMEFPVNTKNSDGSITTGLTRIESNCYHGPGYWQYMEGRYADHGNTISYVTVLYKETVWDIALGTGYGDSECNGHGGFSMPNRSTFLYITRMGDVQ